VKAVEILLSNSHRRGEWIATELDLSFISQQWQKLVIIQSKDATKVMRRHFEICIFSDLAAELKSGDICVFNSETYADYREQLLSWQDCQPLVETYCQQLGFSTQAEDFVENLKNLLTQTAVEVDLGYPNNTSVVISEEGEPVLKRPKVIVHRQIPDGFEIKTVSVTKKADGYYVTLSLEDKTVPKIKPDFNANNIVGIDVGLIDFIVTSDDERIAAPKFLRKAERKLKSAQRRVSRRNKGSNRRKKAIKGVAELGYDIYLLAIAKN
jgi:hypothetical protein